MKKRYLITVIIFTLITLLAISVYFYVYKKKSFSIVSPIGNKKEKKEEYPLRKYQFENLKNRLPEASKINLEKVLEKKDEFTQYRFFYKSEEKNISGLANIPVVKESTSSAKFPVIVQIRGYVDREIYETGLGTKPSGEVYAANGYITLAPDFLGYGASDMPPNDVWEDRFLRPVNVIDLIASVETIKQADPENIFLWGHSNGGMIALSVLELTGKKYPTTLWAPVTQFFPYDILYYTYEYDDGGKALRKSLSLFEQKYDTEKYTFANYTDWINAFVQIHQGEADEYIPLWWTTSFVDKLNKKEKEVIYYQYPDTDHNMRGSWNTVVQRDLEFFNSRI